MATKFHLSPDGTPRPCNPAKTGVCKYGEDKPHFDSQESARDYYESTNNDEAFSVVIKKGSNEKQKNEERNIQSFDKTLEENIANFEKEFNASSEKNEWVNDKVDELVKAETNLYKTLPGTPESKAALNQRTKSREELLAADLVIWRNSDFYNENVEERMKSNTIAITDADASIETALADKKGKQSVALEYGISERDVENILEVAQKDYLRPRGGLSKNISDLSQQDGYTETTAYVFRVEPDAVRGVLNYASNYSKV